MVGETADEPTVGRVRSAPDVLWLAGISIVAASVAFAVSRHGTIPSPDGTLYLGAGSNLANGRGLTVPFTTYTDHYRPIEAVAFDGQVPLRQWPPLYPIVLAAFAAMGTTTADVVRLLNPLLLGVNVALLGVLSRRLFRTSWLPLFVVLAVVVVVRSPDPIAAPLLYLHATALSEPLFTLWTLAALIALDRFVVTSASGWLWGAAALAGAASATKLLGLSLVATVCLVAVTAPGSVARRLARTAAAAALGVIPVAATLRMADGRETAADAQEALAALNGAVRGFATLIPGVANSTVPGVVGFVAVLGMIAGLSFIAWRRPDRRSDVRRIVPLIVVSGAMIAQLAYSAVFVDRFIPLVGRQLTLPLILLTTAALATLSLVVQPRHRNGVAIAAAIVCVGVFIQEAPGIAEVITTPPPPTRTVKERYLPTDGALFSNAPDAVFLGAGRTSYMVPCTRDYFSGTPNADYDAEMEELLSLVGSGRAAVLLRRNRLRLRRRMRRRGRLRGSSRPRGGSGRREPRSRSGGPVSSRHRPRAGEGFDSMIAFRWSRISAVSRWASCSTPSFDARRPSGPKGSLYSTSMVSRVRVGDSDVTRSVSRGVTPITTPLSILRWSRSSMLVTVQSISKQRPTARTIWRNV